VEDVTDFDAPAQCTVVEDFGLCLPYELTLAFAKGMMVYNDHVYNALISQVKVGESHNTFVHFKKMLHSSFGF